MDATCNLSRVRVGVYMWWNVHMCRWLALVSQDLRDGADRLGLLLLRKNPSDGPQGCAGCAGQRQQLSHVGIVVGKGALGVASAVHCCCYPCHHWCCRRCCCKDRREYQKRFQGWGSPPWKHRSILLAD